MFGVELNNVPVMPSTGNVVPVMPSVTFLHFHGITVLFLSTLAKEYDYGKTNIKFGNF